MSDVKKEYLPGVCNIGAAEKVMRRRAGWAGLVLTVLLWGLFIVFRVAAPWRLFVFLPAMLGASGFLQAAMSFCVNFGMRGVQNFGETVGEVTAVEEANAVRKDRGRSVQIIGYSVAIAVVVAVMSFATGLLV